jgi:hypothetical protein
MQLKLNGDDLICRHFFFGDKDEPDDDSKKKGE